MRWYYSGIPIFFQCDAKKTDPPSIIVTFQGKKAIIIYNWNSCSHRRSSSYSCFSSSAKLEHWRKETSIVSRYSSKQHKKNLPCAPHIIDIILKSVFDTVIWEILKPDVYFKRFKESWSNLDSTKNRYWVDVVTEGVCDNMIEFLEDQLRMKQHRGGYFKLLKFAVTFHCCSPQREVSYRIHARWITMAILVF